MHQDGTYLSTYKERMIEIMKKINPDWKRKDIEKELSKMIDDRCQIPVCTLDNNYTGETRETNLLSVLDWAMDEKPILTGNMTYYKNQDQAINPIATMLKDKLAERKALKKKMYQYVDNKAMYDALDRAQGNVKRLVNSYYGASGMPSSKFYSKWSGPATTSSAQEVISSCEQLFEGYVADNYDFINLTECMEWCTTALSDFDYLDDFIQLQSIPTLEERLYDKILNHEDNDMEILDDFLSNLSDDEITFLYYKNNMIEFIDNHKLIQDIIYDVFANVINLDYINEKDDYWYSNIPDEYKDKFNGKTAKDYNKFVNVMYFMDPNDPPKNIIEYLDELNVYMMKYVFVNYLSFDRIYRLRNFKRKCVTVIDTDSNILSIDTIVNYIFDNIVKGETFGRKFINNEFIVVNMMTFLITAAVKTILYTYSCKANICEDYRELLAMKSEFFFKKLVIGKTKKRYISKITLREGTYINPPKYDIKGFNPK